MDKKEVFKGDFDEPLEEVDEDEIFEGLTSTEE